MLRHIPAIDDPRVLVGALTRDDAAVVRIGPDRAIAVTVDFFTPIVDDPYAFGSIAAANALSDLYAMGATPLCALNLVAWPRTPEVLALLGDAVRGMVDVAREAGALIVGGHSIDDPEPKLGMVALGEIHPDRAITIGGARPGDQLVLTKPLGTGVMSTALKRGWIGEAEMASAIASMRTLNAPAARAMRDLGDAVHAATDVTGFGLLGHLRNMLEASGAAAVIHAPAVPSFPLVADLITRGAVPGGTERNLEAASRYTRFSDEVSAERRVLLADAQTSGGLLVAVAPGATERLTTRLSHHGATGIVIGEIVAGDGAIEVRGSAG